MVQIYILGLGGDSSWTLDGCVFIQSDAANNKEVLDEILTQTPAKPKLTHLRVYMSRDGKMWTDIFKKELYVTLDEDDFVVAWIGTYQALYPAIKLVAPTGKGFEVELPRLPCTGKDFYESFRAWYPGLHVDMFIRGTKTKFDGDILDDPNYMVFFNTGPDSDMMYAYSPKPVREQNDGGGGGAAKRSKPDTE